MAKNRCLAKSIFDAGWYQLRQWLEHSAKVFGRCVVAVAPHYTSEQCPSCGAVVKKSLSSCTHVCECGCKLDRDEDAAINSLNIGLNTVGHTEIYASGDPTALLVA